MRAMGRSTPQAPERVYAKDPVPLKVKEVEVESRRHVVCLNEEEKRRDAPDRVAILICYPYLLQCAVFPFK